jgi:lysine decarboxylase
MLHLQGNRIDYARVASAVRFFTSTSPSCLIVASLDVARMQMATEGEKLLSETLRLPNMQEKESKT